MNQMRPKPLKQEYRAAPVHGTWADWFDSASVWYSLTIDNDDSVQQISKQFLVNIKKLILHQHVTHDRTETSRIKILTNIPDYLITKHH